MPTNLEPNESRNLNPNERYLPLSKDALDTVNSLTWFLMDAFWMVGATQIALAFILPTVLTGICLLYTERRPTVFWINVAINCWIGMNTFWMLGDLFEMPEALTAARVTFGLGLVAIGIAVKKSEDLRETFSHFRRFRVLKIRK